MSIPDLILTYVVALLAGLGQDKAALKDIRKGLENLQSEISTTEQLKRAYDAITKMKKAYDEAIKAGG